jgi:hypothetical protein
MHPEMETLRCAIVRGGTSKGVFIMMNEYPKDPAKRDAAILAVYGSPDLRQIDGLGGADVLTSKHAIISRSSRPDADVDYTFAQVSFESAFVDYGGNCGNISSAVGPFAIDEEAVEPITTTVRIRMTNSDKILVAEVLVKGGKAMVDGDFAMAFRALAQRPPWIGLMSSAVLQASFCRPETPKTLLRWMGSNTPYPSSMPAIRWCSSMPLVCT